jgi:hypothetical protein
VVSAVDSYGRNLGFLDRAYWHMGLENCRLCQRESGVLNQILQNFASLESSKSTSSASSMQTKEIYTCFDTFIFD